MIYVGIDYHKKYSQFEAMDKEGKTIARARLANEEDVLRRWFSSLPESCEGMDEVERIHVGNPCKVKAIAEAKIKPDTIHAATLAHLLRANLIPPVYVPSEDTRRKKEILRQRIFPVSMKINQNSFLDTHFHRSWVLGKHEN